MRNIAKGLFGILVAVFLLAAASSARADTWNFAYSGNGGADVASGLLTTTPLSLGLATITEISGLYNGSAITGLLAPGTCCSFPSNDNELIFPGPVFLSDAGLGFQVGSLDVNLFSISGSPGYQAFTSPPTTILSVGTFNVTPASATVPEPATIALLGSGLLGLFLTRKPKHT